MSSNYRNLTGLALPLGLAMAGLSCNTGADSRNTNDDSHLLQKVQSSDAILGISDTNVDLLKDSASQLMSFPLGKGVLAVRSSVVSNLFYYISDGVVHLVNTENKTDKSISGFGTLNNDIYELNPLELMVVSHDDHKVQIANVDNFTAALTGLSSFNVGVYPGGPVGGDSVQVTFDDNTKPTLAFVVGEGMTQGPLFIYTQNTDGTKTQSEIPLGMDWAWDISCLQYKENLKCLIPAYDESSRKGLVYIATLPVTAIHSAINANQPINVSDFTIDKGNPISVDGGLVGTIGNDGKDKFIMPDSSIIAEYSVSLGKITQKTDIFPYNVNKFAVSQDGGITFNQNDNGVLYYMPSITVFPELVLGKNGYASTYNAFDISGRPFLYSITDPIPSPTPAPTPDVTPSQEPSPTASPTPGASPDPATPTPEVAPPPTVEEFTQGKTQDTNPVIQAGPAFDIQVAPNGDIQVLGVAEGVSAEAKVNEGEYDKTQFVVIDVHQDDGSIVKLVNGGGGGAMGIGEGEGFIKSPSASSLKTTNSLTISFPIIYLDGVLQSSNTVTVNNVKNLSSSTPTPTPTEVPSSSPTPTSTPVTLETPTLTPEATTTSSPVPTETPTASPSSSPVSTDTPNPTSSVEATVSPSPTDMPTSTSTPETTASPVPTSVPTEEPIDTTTPPDMTAVPSSAPTPTMTAIPEEVTATSVPTQNPTSTPAPTQLPDDPTATPTEEGEGEKQASSCSMNTDDVPVNTPTGSLLSIAGLLAFFRRRKKST